MKKILLVLTSAFFLSAYGQRTCGTVEKAEEQFAKDPIAQANRESLRNFLTSNNYAQSRTAGVITIPVVVHVIYKNATQNISDAQIASQIKILNDDFDFSSFEIVLNVTLGEISTTSFLFENSFFIKV